MGNEYTEVTTTSWGSRIVGSLTGIIFGLLFFIVAFPLLWWNEGRSLHRIRTLDEGRSLVIAVATDRVNPANNGKLIYVSGKATTDEILNDALFGVHENALKLNRIVDMYQWKETKSTTTHKNLGGSETQDTAYSYSQVWSDQWINSSEFKHPEGHQNPSSMPYKSQLFTASNVNVGAFKPTSEFIAKISGSSDYPVTGQMAAEMNEQLKRAFKLDGTRYFYGDPANPQIGAMSVHYAMTQQPTSISIIGKKNNTSIEPYYTRYGVIQLLAMGTVGADSMFAAAEDINTLVTWLVRLGGFLLMWFGMGMILRPISVLGDIIPLMGSIAGAGIGLMTFIASIAISFITIAVAWLFCRPLLGVALLIAAGAFLFGGMNLIRKAKDELRMKLTKHAL